MENVSYFGFLAAICTTLSFFPQVIRILRTGNVDGISLTMYSLFTFGVLMWLTYGILLSDLPMILANGTTLILAVMVLSLTIKKRRQ